MPIEALKRVLWRIRKNHPNKKFIRFTDMRMAIVKECGYDERTYKRVMNGLRRVKYIKSHNKWSFELTGADLSE